MPRTAFIVVGPEGSGTRFTTSLFIRAGCDGDSDHQQRWDAEKPKGSPIVWRRSYLHGTGREFPFVRGDTGVPDFGEMLDHLEGYDPFFVICNRDWFAVYQSCRAKGHRYTLDQFLSSTQGKYADIMSFAIGREIPFRMFHYEAAVHQGGYIDSFLRTCGLPPVGHGLASDANLKHYGGSDA